MAFKFFHEERCHKVQLMKNGNCIACFSLPVSMILGLILILG
jgi:hypothetical protein